MSLFDDVKKTAQALVTAAGSLAAIASTDIDSQARHLAKTYPQYSAAQISNQISDEIKKTHRREIGGR